MIIGSHNSWSYLTIKPVWYDVTFGWIVRCQDKDIRQQYSMYNVNCFDLRVKFDDKGKLQVCHNKAIFYINQEELDKDLQFINDQGECYVRVLLDVRNAKDYTPTMIYNFILYCKDIEKHYPKIKFFGGRNLYDWKVEHEFKGVEPSVCEKCGSVTKPKWLNGLWPKRFARKHNREILEQGTDKDILLIDFVNIPFK